MLASCHPRPEHDVKLDIYALLLYLIPLMLRITNKGDARQSNVKIEDQNITRDQRPPN